MVEVPLYRLTHSLVECPAQAHTAGTPPQRGRAHQQQAHSRGPHAMHLTTSLGDRGERVSTAHASATIHTSDIVMGLCDTVPVRQTGMGTKGNNNRREQRRMGTKIDNLMILSLAKLLSHATICKSLKPFEQRNLQKESFDVLIDL